MLSDESRYRILRLIERNPAISQRQIARELGISLGKTNYCIKALMDRGVLKAKAFLNSNNKRAYIYVLTPHGLEERTRITIRFLKKKMVEYEAIREEIVELTKQARKLGIKQHQMEPRREPGLK